MKLKFLIAIPIIMGGVACAQANELPPGALYREKVQPILTHYCYDCHADGADKGGISLDKFASDAALVTNKDLWLAVLKNVRAGLMPPAKRKERPSEAEVAQLA